MNKLDTRTDLAEYIREYIHSVWKSRDKSLFPGPHPVSIERKHFPLLTQNRYVVCEKTDGTRFFLVCVKFKESKYAVFVNRAMDMYTIRVSMPANTIIDGELIEDRFIIYDGIIINGEYIGDLNFIERLKHTECVTKAPPIPGIKLKMKTMWNLSQFKELYNKKFDYEIDGYIFTPVDEPIRMETHETMFKWKPLDRITMDFIVTNSKLYVWDRKHGYIYIQDCDYSQYEGKIIECKLNESKQWSLVKVRNDKTFPNNRRTYLRTLANISENIKPEEFFSYKK